MCLAGNTQCSVNEAQHAVAVALAKTMRPRSLQATPKLVATHPKQRQISASLQPQNRASIYAGRGTGRFEATKHLSSHMALRPAEDSNTAQRPAGEMHTPTPGVLVGRGQGQGGKAHVALHYDPLPGTQQNSSTQSNSQLQFPQKD